MMAWNEFLRWIGAVFKTRPYHDADWYEVMSDEDHLRHLLAVPLDARDPRRYQCETLWEIYQERYWHAHTGKPASSQARMMMWSRRVAVLGNN